jgi:glutaminyl-tRNA synthetase
LEAEVRLYDNLFTKPAPGAEGGDPLADLNPNSMEILRGCKVEPSLALAQPGENFQFERLAYFCADPDGAPGRPVFNRVVGLKDTWGKIEKARGAA